MKTRTYKAFVDGEYIEDVPLSAFDYDSKRALAESALRWAEGKGISPIGVELRWSPASMFKTDMKTGKTTRIELGERDGNA